MKGIWKMLTGQGEKEYRQQHKAFNDAIPDDWNGDETIEEKAAKHPAYSGATARSHEAFDYRRAHYMRGPQSKREHEEFAAMQKKLAQYEKENRVSSYMTDSGFLEWLDRQ